ncbi:MAG: VTT domain-containing protein [Dehalococcoidales bacterium]
MAEQKREKKISTKAAYALGIFGIAATLLMAAAVVYYWEWVHDLGAYGYVGAFLISILGGATIIVPVPMLAVIFALGRVMEYTWLVGIANGLGETVGALTIYMTGYGGGSALYNHTHGKLQSSYEKLMQLMERRGWLILFVLAAVLNPFFYPAALAAGALRFGAKRYLLITCAGKIIKGLTVAYAGYWGLRGLLRMLGAPI